MSIVDSFIYHVHIQRLNIVKTILFNFKTMPFKIAMKLPVFIYGKVDFYALRGRVEFENCQVVRGMIKLGKNIEYLGNVKGASLILMSEESKIVFRGPCRISNDFLLRIGRKAVLTLGYESFFGSSMKIVCLNNITVGNYTQIAFESQIIDSDFHYILDIDKNEVGAREKNINIGDFNWFGNRCSVAKGTITKPYTIVASGSLTNKDYSIDTEIYDVLAGSPAKIVGHRRQRIFSLSIEDQLVKFYQDDENKSIRMNEVISNILKG